MRAGGDLSRVGVMASGLWLLGCGGLGRDRYVDQNEKLLASIPIFPGATRLEVDSSSYFREDGGGPIGYSTRHTFRLPAKATRVEVAAFYKVQLAGEWSLVEALVEARGERVVGFCREGGSLSVNLESASILELGVDHDAFDKEGHPQSCASLRARG